MTSTTNAADVAIAWARAQIGKPYRLGAAGPDAFDCSGLIQQAYKAAGVQLPRTTYQMLTVGKTVTKDQLAPGDLVFPTAGHVQLYTGSGNIVEAPKAGDTVVERGMWGFMTARRVTDTPGSAIPVLNPVIDLTNKVVSSALNGAGDLLGVGDLATSVGQIAIRVVVVVAGLGLVVLGLARAVSPAVAAAAQPITQTLGAAA